MGFRGAERGFLPGTSAALRGMGAFAERYGLLLGESVCRAHQKALHFGIAREMVELNPCTPLHTTQASRKSTAARPRPHGRGDPCRMTSWSYDTLFHVRQVPLVAVPGVGQHRLRLHGERLLYRVEQHRHLTLVARVRRTSGPSPPPTGARRPRPPARCSTAGNPRCSYGAFRRPSPSYGA